jgi:23S rRNA pseudouridine2604 synthase
MIAAVGENLELGAGNELLWHLPDDFAWFIKHTKGKPVIMGRKTLPCQLIQINDLTFKITLIQGLNRQIRRMCYKLNYEVLGLKRVRIGDVNLENLKAGEYRILEVL